MPDTQHQILMYHHINKSFPGLERSPALQRFVNYSKKRENVETLYKKIPFYSPTYKRKMLMDSFGHKDGAVYLASADIEEQKLQVKNQMERQNQLIATLDANIEANEQEWIQDTAERNQSLITDNNDEDVRKMELFWDERDSAELDNWNVIVEQSIQWVYDHQYEIENHFTTFDWLKIYTEAIQDYGLDMDRTLRIVSQETGVNLKNGKSAEEWAQLAEVAKYLVTYKETAKKMKKESFPEISEFLSKQVDMPENLTHASLWQQALAKKNEFLLE